MPLSLHLSWNSSNKNEDALSETMLCGYPKWAKSSSSSSVVDLEDVDVIGCMQVYLEYASMSTSRLDPQHGLYVLGSKASQGASMDGWPALEGLIDALHM